VCRRRFRGQSRMGAHCIGIYNSGGGSNLDERYELGCLASMGYLAGSLMVALATTTLSQFVLSLVPCAISYSGFLQRGLGAITERRKDTKKIRSILHHAGTGKLAMGSKMVGSVTNCKPCDATRAEVVLRHIARCKLTDPRPQRDGTLGISTDYTL
jgi:hypothetical protein